MKLELKNIAGYLPYELKCHAMGEHIDNDDTDSEPKTLTVTGTYTDSYNERYIESVYDGDKFEILFGTDFFPLLRPMSDLYKEIDGVVGIVELTKMILEPYLENIDGYGITVLPDDDVAYKVVAFKGCEPLFDVMFDNDLVKGFVAMERSTEFILPVHNQLDLFTYLFTHHYDIYNLIDKGLAIDINTIKQKSMEFKGTNELKYKIAEMQKTIDELTKALEEASLLLEDGKNGKYYETNKDDWSEAIVNCIGNDLLFQAVTAMREDTDEDQWFTNGKEWIFCDRQDWIDMYSVLCSGGRYNYNKNGELDKFSKATLAELQEHFK